VDLPTTPIDHHAVAVIQPGCRAAAGRRWAHRHESSTEAAKP